MLQCPALGPGIYPERHPGQPAEITIIISPTSFGTARRSQDTTDKSRPPFTHLRCGKSLLIKSGVKLS
jgi:hypothetical protein